MSVASIFSPPKQTVRNVPTPQETEKEIQDPEAEEKAKRRARFTNRVTGNQGVTVDEANIGRRKLLGG